MSKNTSITQKDVFLTDNDVGAGVDDDLELGRRSGICCEWGSIKFTYDFSYTRVDWTVTFILSITAHGEKERDCVNNKCPDAPSTVDPAEFGFSHACFAPCRVSQPFDGPSVIVRTCPYDMKVKRLTAEASQDFEGYFRWKFMSKPEILEEVLEKQPDQAAALIEKAKETSSELWDGVVNSLSLCKPIDKPAMPNPLDSI